MIRVIIADDHEIVREGLKQILEKNTDIAVVGEAKDGMEAVNICKKLKPDIIIMDIGMPVLNGIEAAEEIFAKNPDDGGTRIIILSMYADDTAIMRSLDVGVSGFLLKTGDSKELVAAIRAVAKGQSYLTPGISAKVLECMRFKKYSPKTGLALLTLKEKHILQLIAEGKSTKEIANMFNKSFHTIKTHRNHIMEKLQLRSIAELTRFAIENKLVIYNIII